MKLTRALFVLFASLAILLLAAVTIPQAYANAGATGAVAIFFALSTVSALVMRPGAGVAYGNTLTNLIPVIYEAMDVVSRELVGFIPAVTLDAKAEQIAKGQTVYSPVAPANTQSTITPAMTVTAASDQTIGTKSLTIDSYKTSGFNWTGEEAFSMDSGPGLVTIMRDQISQCLRVHTNAIESAIASVAQLGSSRAYGTSAVTPFASDLSAAAQIKKILDDNGAPGGQTPGERSLVINTTAGANVRALTQLTNVNQAGTDATLRRGALLNIFDFGLRESAGVITTTAGTGTNYQINNGPGYAIGDTSLTVGTGSGTILAGDVITIGSFKYVVATTLAANVVVIAQPGLRAAVANTAAVTVNAAYTANIGFSRNAISLATRLPKVIPNDMATDRIAITDPVSGIAFEFAMYPGYRMVKYEVAIAYGVTAWKPEHIATLLG